MAKDVNEFIADDFIRHSIDLDRFSAREYTKALDSLKDLETELISKLQDRAQLTSFQAARTEALLQQTQATIAKRYRKVWGDRLQSLETVYELEKQFVVQTANNRIGASVMTVFTDEKVTRRAIDRSLIKGAPSAVWWSRQADGLRQRFEGAVRVGILAGETNDQIVRRVRGTRANNFEDGIMSASRREAQALVRTSVQAVANRAKMDTYEENADLLKGVQQRSTLDSSTTNICKSYSGLVWRMKQNKKSVSYVPDGHDKKFANVDSDGMLHYGPPRHWKCRSTLVPLTPSWEELSGKKVKTPGDKEKTFQKKFEDRLRKRGFTPEQIKNIKANTRASMNGQVPADLSYEDWLKTQPTDVQVDALGAERWRLWKDGKIDNFRQLTDNSGRPLTLDELIAKVKPKKPLKRKPKPKPKPPPPKPKPKTKPKPKLPATPPPEPILNQKPDAVVPKLNVDRLPINFRARMKAAVNTIQKDEFSDIVNKVPAVKRVQFNDADQGAWYGPGRSTINLHTHGWSGADTTIIHEYGHHIDFEAGRRALPGTSNANFRYMSTLAHKELRDANFKIVQRMAAARKAKDAVLAAGHTEWAVAITTGSTRGLKLAKLRRYADDVGASDTLQAILKHYPDNLPVENYAYILKKAFDKDYTTQYLARKSVIKQLTKEAEDIFPTVQSGKEILQGFARATDKGDYLDKTLERLRKNKKIPFTDKELQDLCPGMANRTAFVQAWVNDDLEAVIENVSDTFLDDYPGKIRSMLDDFFGSITGNTVGSGHSDSYYVRGTKKNMDGIVVSENGHAESFTHWLSARTRKGGSAVTKIMKEYAPELVNKYDQLIKKYITDWTG